jgi:serine/threonine protein kinase
VGRKGRVIDGRYRLEDPVGKGGMGVVYSALNLKLNRKVAVKFITSEYSKTEAARKRFIAEVETLSKLSSVNSVSIIDWAGEDREELYYVMEFLEGESLEDRLKRDGHLPWMTAARWIADASQALQEAHSVGLVHRDIKTANLFLKREPAVVVVKVLDYGLARPVQRAGARLDEFEGSPDYVAPEQLFGHPPDFRSDIYSLAVVLFECVAGFRPVQASSFEALCHAKLSVVPPLLSSTIPNGQVPEALDDLVERCLAVDPGLRPASMEEVHKSLVEILEAHKHDTVVEGKLPSFDGLLTAQLEGSYCKQDDVPAQPLVELIPKDSGVDPDDASPVPGSATRTVLAVVGGMLLVAAAGAVGYAKLVARVEPPLSETNLVAEAKARSEAGPQAKAETVEPVLEIPMAGIDAVSEPVLEIGGRSLESSSREAPELPSEPDQPEVRQAGRDVERLLPPRSGAKDPPSHGGPSRGGGNALRPEPDARAPGQPDDDGWLKHIW